MCFVTQISSNIQANLQGVMEECSLAMPAFGLTRRPGSCNMPCVRHGLLYSVFGKAAPLA